MHHRQIAVEHDHVIRDDSGARERVAPVMGDIDGHPLTAQTSSDRLGQKLMILDK